MIAGTVVGATAVYLWQHKPKRVETAVRPPFSQQYGPWAIVTGAARKEGIGYGFARHLAGRHLNLVLVDVLEEELAARAAELRQKYHVKVETVTLDLGKPDFLPALQAVADKLEIGLLVCNHMFTPKETLPILQMDLDTHHAMLDINARAYTTLMHGYGRQMVAQNHGGIIIVSSQAGLRGTPYTGAYSANKAFQMVLGESLWYELRNTNVDMLVLAPGLTNTQGDALADYPQIMLMEVDPVVTEATGWVGQKTSGHPRPGQ
ncbi:MAG: SDR family NAD(P)-dependent oxidoreductase [Chloroflexi bacterium]|nr:SDR family NAD(P)-dependent oxidoreductase [Ardenticatenaceae bacterium]NOG33310.1 SDR family NAD(P)-dependent oxidoreductase [Chloroflexota bacterium]GIK56133.1 MAG: hypothetical protein BroJett015_17960 [Chloroflexota bacterium]